MATDGSKQGLFLGFDFSTQQLKIVAVNYQLIQIYSNSIKFDTDLPHYGTKNGVIFSNDGITVTAPTVMFIEALDMLLEKMKLDGFNFQQVLSLSGCGQQHGSVYWKSGSLDNLKKINSDKRLCEQLNYSFSIPQSPIWMDSSTSIQCRNLEKCVGGPLKLAEITGSRAYERFTGNQIAKISQHFEEEFTNTERISLISSFAASLFLCDYAPIDQSDASGMNLFDLQTRSWNYSCLSACSKDSPGLEKKLSNVVLPNSVIGKIAPYFCDKYNFSSDCSVVAFTGDNPASLAGLRQTSLNDVCISLGTSDTLFVCINEPHPVLDGHIFINPCNSNYFMALLCYKNGSVCRENVKNRLCSDDENWEKFNTILQNTKPGNNGFLGIFYDNPEITPSTNFSGVFRFNSDDEKIVEFPNAETEIRALIEGQFLAKKVHAENIGLIWPLKRIIITGGASSNTSICQIISNIFEAPIYRINEPNSTCLGGAYRAKHAYLGNISFEETVKGAGEEFKLVVEPNKNTFEIYRIMAERYRKIEAIILNVN